MSRHRRPGEPDVPWATGWAQYWIERRQGEHSLVVAARCRIAPIGSVELALVDTGAQWSLIGGELAELARPHLVDRVPGPRYSTRLGTFDTERGRVEIELVADHGMDLVVDATVLLAPDWTGPPMVIGYRGLLERIRIAFDPGSGASDQWLGFGGE